MRNLVTLCVAILLFCFVEANPGGGGFRKGGGGFGGGGGGYGRGGGGGCGGVRFVPRIVHVPTVRTVIREVPKFIEHHKVVTKHVTKVQPFFKTIHRPYQVTRTIQNHIYQSCGGRGSGSGSYENSGSGSEESFEKFYRRFRIVTGDDADDFNDIRASLSGSSGHAVAIEPTPMIDLRLGAAPAPVEVAAVEVAAVSEIVGGIVGRIGGGGGGGGGGGIAAAPAAVVQAAPAAAQVAAPAAAQVAAPAAAPVAVVDFGPVGTGGGVRVGGGGGGVGGGAGANVV